MSADYYNSSLDHILAELERIDLLIQAQVSIARQVNQVDQNFQGLCIQEDEISELLASPVGLPRWATTALPLSLQNIRTSLDRLSTDINKRKEESFKRGIRLYLPELQQLFGLTKFDVDALLICLAPEFDLRYERIYSYLQDDVTRKRPSVDLILNLLSESIEAKIAARSFFSSKRPLLKYELLQLFDDSLDQPVPLLRKYLKVDERIVRYLLGTDETESSALSYCTPVKPVASLGEMLLPDDVIKNLSMLCEKHNASGRGMLFYFQGGYGVGKQTTAEALCGRVQLGLLLADLEKVKSEDAFSFERLLSLIWREARLKKSAVYWNGFDSLLLEDKRALLEVFLHVLERQKVLTFLGGSDIWEPVDALYNLPFVRVEFAKPSCFERLQLWTNSLNGTLTKEAAANLEAIANKFAFSGGQIRDAASTAGNLAQWRDPEDGQISTADIHTACRLQSNRRLSSLARKITPFYKWDDIVLPSEKKKQLWEVCNSLKYRSLVYDDWGFDKKLSLGKGLTVLFTGASGTGKTMAAEVIAGELGLDLYKIDLSSMISKYIGETEKNLSRIFSEAETSNAILFFDEADALFGKRSEVRDSHDRYANIETSYLLQRMEEYEGVVILATNLSKNMDDAFVRRMHFTIEFPFPSEKYRRRIWEGIWTEKTPRAKDIDLEFMGSSFEIAGGNIKNVALAAAFLAAADGKIVNMHHLINATRREYQKMGKVVVDGEFGEYGRMRSNRETT